VFFSDERCDERFDERWDEDELGDGSKIYNALAMVTKLKWMCGLRDTSIVLYQLWVFRYSRTFNMLELPGFLTYQLRVFVIEQILYETI